MDSPEASAAPVTYPVFAAVALGITGSTVYQVIELVGGMFERAGSVFEGSPDAPGTLLALLPPSEAAAMQAVRLGLQAQAAAPALRLGIDATEVHSKKEQDARWQQVIDSALRLQKAARSGEAIAGDEVEQLTQGAIATQSLQVGEERYLLLTGVRDLSVVPEPGAPPDASAVAIATPSLDASSAAAAPVEPAEPVAQPDLRAEPAVVEHDPEPIAPIAVPDPEPVPIPVASPPPAPAVQAPAELSDRQPTAGASTGAMRAAVKWDGRLAGREDALADLGARFDRVVKDGVGAVVSVTGAAGVGKTRLVRAFTEAREGDARVWQVRCPTEDAGGVRWPLAAIVEAAVGLDPRAPAGVVMDRLGERFAGQPDADRVIPQLAAMLALDGRVHPDAVRWSVRRAIEVGAQGTPTILHVDDADRAPARCVRFIADVATSVRRTPLLVVVTSQRETEGVAAIRLPALQAHEAVALVEDLLGAAEAGVGEAVARRAGGDPFLIEQILATLAESGTLAPGNGRWVPLADLGTVPLPEGAVGIVRRRLQSLPPHALAVLGVAAVAGERFVAAPLADVVPQEAAPALEAHLADLVTRGFLVDEGRGTFSFRHAGIREATMGGVPDWARAAVHRRVARDLEQRAGERMWRFADEIGAHLAAVCELSPDAAPTDRDEAVELLAWSAAGAVEQGDLDGAARIERRAAMLVDEPVRRAELLYLAAEHGAIAAPERPADREIAEAALAASVAGDDVDWRVRLLRATLRTTAGHDDALEGARATADEALAAFGEDATTWATSKIWALLGLVHARRAQNGLVADDLLHAADHAGAVGRRREETDALRGAAAALLDGPVAVEEAEARCRAALERVRGPLAEHDLRSAIAVLEARRGAFDDARSTIARSAAALEELGAARELAVVLHRTAQIEVLAGQPNAAEPQMQRALAAAANARDDALRAALAGSFAHILVADDERLDEALALADVAESHADGTASDVAWRMARARVLVRRGRAKQAEALVREGLSLAEQTDSTDLRANTLAYAADVRRQAGRPAEAEPFERRAHRLFQRRGATAQAAAVQAILRPAGDPHVADEGADALPPVDDAAQTVGDTDQAVVAAEPAVASLADEMMSLVAEMPSATSPVNPPEATDPPSPSSPSPEGAAPTDGAARVDVGGEELEPPAQAFSTFVATTREEEPPISQNTSEPQPAHRRWFSR
jgi:hypothetical protein